MYSIIFKPFLRSRFIITTRVFCYDLVEKYTGNLYLRRLFKRKNGYPLDLEDPETFQEKVCWKMVNDRNPLLPIVADKYLLYYYVASRVGSKKADQLLIKNYHLVTKAEDLDKIDLPNSFILKSNQGSSRNIICRDPEDVDLDSLKKSVHRWLNSYEDRLTPQWAYKGIKKVILVQKLLEGTDDNPVVEFKLYMLHGRCRLVHFISDRYGDLEKFFMDEKFNVLDEMNIEMNGFILDIIAKHKESLIKLSGTLSEDFDFIRVDFLVHDGTVYLGELTNYPGSVFKNRIPSEYNITMGKEWNLDKDYWKRNF